VGNSYQAPFASQETNLNSRATRDGGDDRVYKAKAKDLSGGQTTGSC
jgi:hypothetical protein